MIAQACAAEGIEFPAAMDAAWSLIRLESSPDLAREIDLDIARFNDLYATCKGLQDTKGAESALKARMRLLVMRDNLK